MNTSKEIEKIIETSKLTGEIALIIIEDETKKSEILDDIKKNLTSTKDYLEVMDLLEKSQSFYYSEEGVKLDDLIYEIVAEYKTGIISLMDRKYKTGLKTVKFDPNNNSMILVLTRNQIELSDQLFEYTGPILVIK